ncbi:MAG: ATP-binding protein [Candidatus Thermoplasmatota archaeon]
MTSLKVLYLEDSPNDRDLTRLQLERASPGGFSIVEATDLASAVRLLGKQPFDVVLADLNVGDSQGIATITSLLKAGCKAPIIAFTGNLDPKSGIEAVAAGASDFVSKGVADPATLANRILYAAKRGPSMPEAALEAVVIERTAALRSALAQLQASNEQLAQQKQWLDVFMQGVPVCCFLVDAQTGRAVFVSEAYAAIYGRPASALLADPNDWIQSIHPDDLARMKAASAARGQGAPRNAVIDYRIIRDGQVAWIQATFTPIASPDGRPGYVAGIIEDVSKEHQVAELEQAGRAKDQALQIEHRNTKFKAQFLNMAAHDLATPVTPLRLQVAAMRTKAKAAKDEGTLASLDMLDRNLVRLTGLIQDVLDVGRIEAGRIKLNPAPLDLAAVVRDDVGTMQAMAEKGGISLQADLRPVSLTGDQDRIGQIVLNLLSNAVKFTPSGGHVVARVDASDGRARLEVTDDGRGISPADLDKLFQPFIRVGDTAKVAGTGLGLYISRGLARLMGGDLVAASPGEGKGATFTLTLPLVPPAEPVAKAAAAS